MSWTSWLQIVEQFAPLILVRAGVPTKYVVPATDLMVEAEAVKDAKGTEKKAHVLAGLNDILTIAKVKEAPAIVAAASNGIDTTIQVVNLVHAKTGTH